MQEKLATEHRGIHEWGGDTSITTSVVSSVAAVAGVEPTALPPLQKSLDTDALEAILNSAREDGVSIAFTYAGRRVTVDADGTIQIEDPVYGH